MSPTPALSSQLVQSLVSLIWPLRYCNDFRPFFTIHDSDFNEITSKQYLPKVLVGVTNPFFSKALGHWPHVLRVSDTSTAPAERSTSVEKVFKKVVNGKKLENHLGLFSAYKSYLIHDKSLAKKLLKIGERPDSVQNAILRRYFLELTQSFIIPLEQYISSLMPLRKQICPFSSVPQTSPFVLKDFLATLQQSGPLLTCGVKGDWKGLYQKFIVSSPNFHGWLTQRTKDANLQLKGAHLESLLSADFSKPVLAAYRQVEVVDLVLKLKNLLEELDAGQVEKRDRIQVQLNSIMESVDDELKSLLLSNGSLREAFEL